MQEALKEIPYKLTDLMKKAEGKYTEEQKQTAYQRLEAMLKQEQKISKKNQYDKIVEVLGHVLQNPGYIRNLAESERLMGPLLRNDKKTIWQELEYFTDTVAVSMQIIADLLSSPEDKVAALSKILYCKENKLKAFLYGHLLLALIHTAVRDENITSTPEGMQLIENLFKVWEEAAGADPDPDKLQRFLKKQEEFIAVHRPAGFMDLLAINGIKTTEPAIRELGRVQFTYDGKYGETEKKIQRLIDIWLAENNYSGAKKDLNTYAILPLADTMRMLGMAVTPDNLRKFKSRLMSKKGGILQNIKRGHIDIDDRRGTGLHAEVGTGSYAVSVPKDQITFQVSDAYAMYQNAAPLGMYSSRTLYLKGPAFLIADKLQDQYFRYGNRAQGTNNILSVKKLLEFLSDTLPSYEAVQQTNRGHWIDRIREPIEEALNQIQQEAGLFKWEYCKRGMQPATPQEIATKDYRKWASLYITYQLIPKEPYTQEQIENRQKRLEAAQEKKALKDAQALIKADNIRKRQRKRKDKEAAKQAAEETSEESENG